MEVATGYPEEDPFQREVAQYDREVRETAANLLRQGVSPVDAIRRARSIVEMTRQRKARLGNGRN